MEIIYLSYDGLSDPLGRSQILPYLEGLSKLGHIFHLISFEKKDRYLRDRELLEKKCQAAGIDWTAKIYHKKPPIVSTLRDLNVLKKSLNKVISANQIDIIHCRSYIPMLTALSYRDQGIKVVFDMRGFWADERADGNIWKINKSPYKQIYSYFKKKEKIFLEQSDAVVSLTEAAIPHLKGLGLKNKVWVIPTAVDLQLFDPKNIGSNELDKMKSSLGLNDSYCIGYSGSLGTWYQLEEMLLFFKTYVELDPKAKLLVITKDDHMELDRLAEDLGIKEKIIIRSAEREEVPLYYACFDSSLMFIKSSFSKKASSPTKLGELMAMGIPVIANTGVGDVEMILDRSGGGMVLKDLDASSFKEAVKSMFSDDFYDKESMYRTARDYYDLKKGIAVYDEIYKDISE